MDKYSFSSDWIKKLEDRKIWEFYWHQQRLMENKILKEEKILEIGVGTKFTYNYLKSKEHDICSIDIDENKKADYVINIVECNELFLDFDVIIAFNVFEHIPYPEFIEVVKKFDKANIKKLFLSFPSHEICLLEFTFKIPKCSEKHIYISFPAGRKKIGEFHHWALGFHTYSKNKLLTDMKSIGYTCHDYFKYRSRNYFYFVNSE